jgi:hypothetical protein
LFYVLWVGAPSLIILQCPKLSYKLSIVLNCYTNPVKCNAYGRNPRVLGWGDLAVDRAQDDMK